MGNTMSSTEQEPAKISYFYGPGFKDIVKVVQTTGKKIRDSVDAITTASASKTPPVGIIMTILVMSVRYAYWLFSAGTMVIASVFFCLFMLMPHVVGFIVIDIVGLLLSRIVRLLDMLYFQIRKVSNVCDVCHNRFTVPVYVCDKCGAKHYDLLPGKYGILHHACTCGQKLPCSTLDLKHPRRKLQAICPFCYKAGREESIFSGGSRAICIPVVGGASTGKSAFITAYARSVIDEVAPSHGLSTRFYDEDREKMYQSMTDAYRDGVVEKTAATTVQGASSAFSFSFFIDGSGVKPSRLMQLLDIAGETFVDNRENERQSQYEHCEGIVLMIDPLAIPRFRALCVDDLDSGDRASISDARLEDVMSALQNDLRQTADADRNGRLRTPLAVVINKVDASPLLDERIGDTAVSKLMAADRENFTNAEDATDFLCRQFLLDMDMGDIVDIVGQQFLNSRFFAVSSIGHTAGNGTGFQPKNVNAVIDWILLNSDFSLAKALGVRETSKAKLPVRQPAIGLYDQILDEATHRQEAAAAAQQPMHAPASDAPVMPAMPKSTSSAWSVPLPAPAAEAQSASSLWPMSPAPASETPAPATSEGPASPVAVPAPAQPVAPEPVQQPVAEPRPAETPQPAETSKPAPVRRVSPLAPQRYRPKTHNDNA